MKRLRLTNRVSVARGYVWCKEYGYREGTYKPLSGGWWVKAGLMNILAQMDPDGRNWGCESNYPQYEDFLISVELFKGLLRRGVIRKRLN